MSVSAAVAQILSIVNLSALTADALALVDGATEAAGRVVRLLLRRAKRATLTPAQNVPAIVRAVVARGR